MAWRLPITSQVAGSSASLLAGLPTTLCLRCPVQKPPGPPVQLLSTRRLLVQIEM